MNRGNRTRGAPGRRGPSTNATTNGNNTTGNTTTNTTTTTAGTTRTAEPKKDADHYKTLVKDITSVDVLKNKIENAKLLEEKTGYEKALKELQDKQAADSKKKAKNEAEVTN
ncbi:hypothetical protein H4219_005671 [Mycoemilia scoparia]|uniref:Uncharacterized protein n=1 Tax=Mycoemilia scoparia TaxID=417184 RepID=A0A9W7ZN65_9FUNG|nr:hypothetical protein H4219_005671 [Mycoemilia scoparia]